MTSDGQHWRSREQRGSGRAFASSNWRTSTAEPVNHPAAPPRSPIDEARRPQKTTQRSTNNSSAIAEGRRIYLGNLPYAAKEREITAFLEEEGYKFTAIDISIDPFSGRNPSYCFIEFDTKDKADRAIGELNRREFLGRPVKVKPCIPKEQRKGSGQNSGYVFDRWQRNDAARHFKGYAARGCRLIVQGLPKPSFQAHMNEKLAKFFQDFDIQAISKTICPHYQGRAAPTAPHYAYVDFASASQAQAAIDALDGSVGPWGTVLKLTKAKTDWNGP
ncbi:hypothetical protein BDV09DRAFT_40430 [Aspergillus tetrazonus]